MESLKIPKAVFFDWDGTLVDTLQGLRRSHNHVRVTLGYPSWSEEQFHSNLKHSARELYPAVYGEKSDEALALLYDYVDTHHLGHLQVLPGAADLLATLKNLGIACGIVSNKRHEFLLKEIKHLGWGDYVQAAVGAGVAARDKPAGDPIVHALSLAGLKPDKATVWYAGDTETDLLAAQDAGCAPVLLSHGKKKENLIETHNPLFVFGDCAEFKIYLNEIFCQSGSDIQRA